MNITYTGRQEQLPPNQQRKLDARFARLAKLVGRKSIDKGVHVALTTVRHLTNAEVTMNFHDRSFVGVGSGPDMFTALTAAVEKAEKQALKVGTRRRDTRRNGERVSDLAAAPETVAAPQAKTAQTKVSPSKVSKKPKARTAAEQPETDGRIFRVDGHERQKPMTLEEATLAIGNRDYMAYMDADKNCVSVLIRRKDGHFDLVES